ncbi:polycystic kidney disease 2-like 1 [Cichlidogyrus casuarinus]|uniref:Polycystic kidney disease 2-like 1 n=1 Tax=Cichlidogyrus casuarinus TaxID=1844966 RepID=A0ABD2QJU4_9PLAT
MGTFVGDVATYGAGGYYVDLPRDKNQTMAVLENLWANLWLDRQTRAIFITFSLYNPNLNLFAICNFFFEFPPSGGVIQKSDVRIANLLRYQTTKDYVCLACEIGFMILIFYYIIEEAIEIHRVGFKYLLAMGNLIDIVVVLVSLICAGFSIYRTIKVNEILKFLVEQQNFFPNFEFVSYWEIQYNYVISLLLFISWIKLFKFINFNRAMTLMSVSLSAAMDDLMSFMVMFAIIFFAYAQLGYLAFGSQATDMSSFSTACFSLLRLILNDFDFTQYKKANRILGPLYFVAFIVICFFILFNMFVAIISKTYEDVADEMHDAEKGYEFSDLFREGFAKIKNKILKRKQEIEGIQQVMEGYDSDDLLHINDFKTALQEQGHLNEDINKMLVKYDVNDDQQLSYKERLQLQADLQERKETQRLVKPEKGLKNQQK